MNTAASAKQTERMAGKQQPAGQALHSIPPPSSKPAVLHGMFSVSDETLLNIGCRKNANRCSHSLFGLSMQTRKEIVRTPVLFQLIMPRPYRSGICWRQNTFSRDTVLRNDLPTVGKEHSSNFF